MKKHQHGKTPSMKMKKHKIEKNGTKIRIGKRQNKGRKKKKKAFKLDNDVSK